MIALNELIDNKEQFKQSYSFIGKDEMIDDILLAENERKKIQLEYENLRALCNKQCHELALKKAGGEDIYAIYNDIIIKDKQIKNLEIVLDKLGNDINSMLKTLPNLPDKLLDEDEKHFFKESKSLKLGDFVNELIQIISNKLNIVKEGAPFDKNEYIESLKNMLFSESEACKLVNCKGEYFVILSTGYEINNIVQIILDYLSDEKINYYLRKSKDMDKSSCLEIVAIINEKENQSVEFLVKREFFTREFNIKYRDTKVDMTKFINQIDILCHT